MSIGSLTKRQVSFPWSGTNGDVVKSHHDAVTAAANRALAALPSDAQAALLAQAVLVDQYVANDFNPMTTGLVGGVGSRAFTLDGLKWWEKDGPLSTDWCPKWGRTKVVLASDGVTLSTGNVLDALTGWVITASYRGSNAGANTAVQVQFNGSEANLIITGNLVNQSTGTTNQHADAKVNEASGLAQASFELTMRDPGSSPNNNRYFPFRLTGEQISGSKVSQVGNLSYNTYPATAIQSVSLVATTQGFLAGSWIKAERLGRV